MALEWLGYTFPLVESPRPDATPDAHAANAEHEPEHDLQAR